VTANELTFTVTVKKRSLIRRLRRLPWVWAQHYRFLRRKNGRIVSAVVAWRLAAIIVNIQGPMKGKAMSR
jgi:hypothetical protein